MRSGSTEPLQLECAYDGTSNHHFGRGHEGSNRYQGFPALVVDRYRALPHHLSLYPKLSAAVPQETRTWLTLGAVAATILTGCRFGSLVISQINSYRARLEARRTFYLTPMSQHSFWTATRQKDGTFVSQIRAALMAKNRTNKTLHLLTARVVRPNMPGEVLQVFINTASDSSWHGVNALPPNDTILVSVNIMIRGFPGRVRENPPDLAVVLAVADDEGNEQRVKLPLKAAPIPLEDAR
jgi:hypothetical protein